MNTTHTVTAAAPLTGTRPRRSALVEFVRACQSAWVCIKRPAFIIPGFAAVGVFAIMMVAGIFMSAARPGGSRVGVEPLFLADLAETGALSHLAGGVVSIVGACALAVAAAHVAGSFTNGSIRIQLVRQPRRGIWLLGNLAVVAAVSVVLTIVAVIAVVASSYLAAAMFNVSTALWLTPASLGPLLLTTLNLSFAMVGYSMLGAVVAIRLRSAIATIGVALCYGLFEELIAAVFPDIARFLPGQLMAGVAVGGKETVPYLWACIGAAIVIALAVLLAVQMLRKRDVLD